MKGSKKPPRKHLQKLYGHYYKRIGHTWSECFYCGDSFYCFDHCPPLSVVGNINIKRFLKEGNKLLLIPACKTCNSALGAYSSINTYDRLTHIHDHYTNKASKYDKMWSQDEINELGHNLRTLVLENINKVKFYQDKADKVAQKITDHLLELEEKTHE